MSNSERPDGQKICHQGQPRGARVAEASGSTRQQALPPASRLGLLCQVISVLGLPCFQNVVVPTSIPQSSSLAPISYTSVSLRASCPLGDHCQSHIRWPTKLGRPHGAEMEPGPTCVDGQPGATPPGQEPSAFPLPQPHTMEAVSDSPL